MVEFMREKYWECEWRGGLGPLQACACASVGLTQAV